MSELAEVLAAAHGGTLRLLPKIITDWRDGPIEGIASLSVGEGLWIFRIFAEDARIDDLSERLFVFSELPEGVSTSWLRDRVAASRAPLVWPFDDQPDQAAVKSAVDTVLKSASRATLVIGSSDFEAVLQAWVLEPGGG